MSYSASQKRNGRERFKQELESSQSGAAGEAEEVRRNPRWSGVPQVTSERD